MSEDELLRVRCLIAEGRAASTSRHADFMAQYGDLMSQLRDFWQSKAPKGTVLPDELYQKFSEFKERWK